MENTDRELILSVLSSNIQLRRLYEEHEILENKLSKFENRGFLTPQEEMELKLLKKRKLQGVDKMMGIISEYREQYEERQYENAA